MSMRVLTLPLKGEYFDAIKAGAKPEEFRRLTPYWRKRIEGRVYDLIELTKGYPALGDLERRLTLPWRGYRVITITHPHFGADPVEVFAIAVTDLSQPVVDWTLAPPDATHVIRTPGSSRFSWVMIAGTKEAFWRWPKNKNWFRSTSIPSVLLDHPYIEPRPGFVEQDRGTVHIHCGGQQ